jgi:TatA/E family protein of Tat protein translocase
MFGISAEHLLIMGVILLVLGPRRLPELGNTLGKAIRNFKDAIGGIEEAQFRRVVKEEQPKAAPKVTPPAAPAVDPTVAAAANASAAPADHTTTV